MSIPTGRIDYPTQPKEGWGTRPNFCFGGKDSHHIGFEGFQMDNYFFGLAARDILV